MDICTAPLNTKCIF